jgi:hypothetical protein
MEKKMPELENWENMVIVAARHGEKYLGWISSEEKDPRAYIEKRVEENKPVELRQVRVLASQIQTQQSPDGGMMIGNLMILMPIDVFPQAVDKINVMASAWYFPSDNDDCKRPLQGLLDNAKQMEVRRMAAEHGISIVGPGTKLPPPPTGRHH